ncbi:MAG: hypothetical protein RBR22_07375, partial [Desulfuromonas sp.]|nr:hypothetical protein [Desulfuromonas sp.]
KIGFNLLISLLVAAGMNSNESVAHCQVLFYLFSTSLTHRIALLWIRFLNRKQELYRTKPVLSTQNRHIAKFKIKQKQKWKIST